MAGAAPERFRPNVTVAAVVERGGCFLVVEEDTADGMRINQPAGHLEPGESLVDAVRRECLEETARVFVPDALLGVYLVRAGETTYLRFAFCGVVGEADPARRLDPPVRRALWLSANELRACRDRHRSPAVLRCVDDHLAGVRHPLALLHADASVFGPHGQSRP